MNKVEPCPTLPELEAFALGVVGNSAIETVTSHLKECEVCRDSLWQLNCNEDPLLSMLREPPPIESFTTEQECLDVVKTLVHGSSDWIRKLGTDAAEEPPETTAPTPKPKQPSSPKPPLVRFYPLWLTLAIAGAMALATLGVMLGRD